MSLVTNKANPNLLALIGFFLIIAGGVAYVALPMGSDRGVILVAVIPIASTLLVGGVVGDRLGRQDDQLNRIQANTNGKSDAERTAIAAEAATSALARHTAQQAEADRFRSFVEGPASTFGVHQENGQWFDGQGRKIDGPNSGG